MGCFGSPGAAISTCAPQARLLAVGTTADALQVSSRVVPRDHIEYALQTISNLLSSETGWGTRSLRKPESLDLWPEMRSDLELVWDAHFDCIKGARG